MPEFRYPHDPKLHKILVKSIEMIYSGNGYEKVSDYINQMGCRSYCIERLFFLGLIWIDSFDFTDELRDSSLQISFKRYMDLKIDDEVFESEKNLLLKEQKIVVATDSIYNFNDRPYYCDESIDDFVKDPSMVSESRESYFVNSIEEDNVVVLVPDNPAIIS